MSTYNPLDWRNENALSNYPLAAGIDLQDFLVDAKFVQFNDFIPVFNYVVIDRANITLAVTFDYGQHTAIVLSKSNYTQGRTNRAVRVYQPNNNRYLGCLVFGDTLEQVWNNYEGRKLVFNVPFAGETVATIPYNDAVYLFDGSFGDVVLGRTEDDNTIFYNVANDANAITINAVGGHAAPQGGVKEGLRKINLVLPKDNNINIASNDVVKLTALNSSSLTVSLVSGSSTAAFTIPTLIA
jgi:hypothetical protein